MLDTVNTSAAPGAPSAGEAVGARVPKVDGIAKLAEIERFGADEIPDNAL